MKRRNREISIFNLSMLDVISGAMAAFLIIMVVLLPYYKKEHIDYQALITELRATLAEAEGRAAAAQAEAGRAREAAESARTAAEAAEEEARQSRAATEAANERMAAAEAAAERDRERADKLARQLAKTFIVLYIRWGTGDDVDLHLIDPSGREFYFGARQFLGHPGELSEDTTDGPGAEVWEVREAPPGEYRAFVELYAIKDPRKPVVIKGRVFHRDGSHALPEVRLHRSRQREPLATMSVDERGDVRVRSP